MKIAVFTGSFDPFTIGHESIINRALPLFDKIFIAIGYNINKEGYFSIKERIEIISTLYKNNDKVIVESFSGLTVDFCKKVNANFILRGMRSSIDLEYEKSIAQVNKTLLPNIETIFLLTEPKYTHISSSIVRELLSYNNDITQFIPNKIDIYKILQNRNKRS